MPDRGHRRVDPQGARSLQPPRCGIVVGMSEPVVAILVAAGLGARYGGPTPKPALRITRQALISMSVEAMAAGGCTDAVVVANPATLGLFAKALAGSPIPVHTTVGGGTRQQSVHNGLRFVRDHDWLSTAQVVLIHDAVRPMVPAHVVEAVAAAVREGAEAVAPAVPVVDSIRMVDPEGGPTRVVDRSLLRAIQTPQGFPLAVILEAHERAAAGDLDFTDDLSCAEASGHRVELVEGSRLAMKITEPTDLTIAKAMWKARATIGHHSGRRLSRWAHR